MKSSRRLRPFLSFGLCSVLIAVSLTPASAPWASSAQGQRVRQPGRGKRVRPEPAQPGAPAGSLPDLDSVRNLPQIAPKAPPPVPSTMRSRRKPLAPRSGRRVGDPLPIPTTTPLPLPTTTPPVPVPTPAVPTPTPFTGGAGGASLVGFISPYQFVGAKGSALYFARFLVSPFSEGLGPLPGSLSPFNQGYGFNASFHFLAPPAPQAGGARIVFSSNRDGNVQIYTMNADGSDQARLTNNGANDDAPRFSPDGTKILFQSDRDDPANGTNDIYVMNSDGTGQTRLTTDGADDRAPAWSPDGSKIVFQSLRNGQSYQVYVMNADGSGQVNLSNSTGDNRQPAYSPDGARIAFASDRDHAGQASVYVMNANGTSQQRLTFGADGVTDEQPVWSRDGGRLAFVSTRDSEVESWQETDEAGGIIYRTAVRTNKEVYLMNADGTGQTRLTSDPGNDDSPYWSPDGSKIVFRSDRERDCCDPTSQVWAMNANGTGAVNLSGNLSGNYGASWTSGGGNQPPVADAGGSYSGVTGQNTAFSGSGSFDPDGSITSYSWSFGDGATGSGASPTHTYSSAGTYTVTLTVTDNLGAQGSNATTVNISSSSSDQFVQNFLQQGLSRQPGGDEGSYWADILRAAYPKGQATMLLAMREFGMTVFESSEYAVRNRSDHWYVYDLYRTYLMRDPDPSGWAWWESRVPEMGREQLRHAFDESIEFGNIVATLTASGPPSSAAASLATARVDPFNQPGDQIRARDCEWGVSLLGLPGRVGMDLGLGLSYSSLVWTRSGPYAYFDEDRGSPSPGFQLGFATIRGPYFDAQVARNVYVLVTSSGSKVSLRQVGTSNTYESADSSYLQLTAGGSGLSLRSTDGTQVSYVSSANGWRATLIEDRNGNYLSVNYDWRGDISSVTDTLGRVVTFNYDANANLDTITQVWRVNGAAQTHTWARFYWGTKALQPGFSSVNAVGAYAGEVIPVLSQVWLHDGTRYTFGYNAAGQVEDIRRYSSDNVERAHTIYDYATLADDCPRLIAERVSADNWTGMNGVPAEVVTQFADAGGGTHTMTTPDGTVYKDTYGAGWQNGLVIQSEVAAEGRQQRLATTLWTQDDTAAAYQTNPRVIETNVYDFPEEGPSNRRRTTIDYGPYAQWGLPYLMTEYASDGATPLRQSYTDYNLAQGYLDRRIIGLVSMTRVYDPAAAKWLAKTTYSYDEAGSVGAQATAAPGHDQSFTSSFLTRGNVTSVSRWDANDVMNAAKAHTSRVTYDAAGSVITSADPLGHQNTLAYADSYSDGNNSRGTFAYPTTLTDGDGFSSTIQYNFDFGARTRVEGPPPEGQPTGLIQAFVYDGAARVERATTVNNGAYTRYVYGPNYVQQLSTVNAVADEAYSIAIFDGLGRTVETAGNHPGSVGGYRAQVTQYDLMGRAAKRSNPAEIDAASSPAGEDAAGWLYTRQTYDWKGRPRITTNTDGTQRSMSYKGCGCAGGEAVSHTDEEGRQQKVYSDALGRRWKIEVLDWDGNVYSTATKTLDALDRVTFARQYQGAEQSSVYQETAITYDGYGRLQSRHEPEQNAGAATVYAYNDDGTLHSITDARNAVTTYTYNGRHLVKGVSYSAPSSIPVPGPVGYDYDAAGNRTWMTDGFGRSDYTYDSLSRMKEEARTFSVPANGIAYGQPAFNNSFKLTYDYNLAGEVISITDSSGTTVNYRGSMVGYNYDSAGRVLNVNGSGFAYASGFTYRAWGAPKGLSYWNGLTSERLYDARLRVSQYTIGGRTPNQQNGYAPPTVMESDFHYYDDERIKYSHDLVDAKFDTAYTYDWAGRLLNGYSGSEAYDFFHGTDSGSPTGAYRQTYTHDEWDNLVGRTGNYWGYPDNNSASYNTQNRRQGCIYDAAGNLTYDAERSYTIDAAGHVVDQHDTNDGEMTQIYDGDGHRIGTYQAWWSRPTFYATRVKYYLHSTVLGSVVSDIQPDGLMLTGYVYADGELLATRFPAGGTSVGFELVHHNPITGSYQTTDQNQWARPRANFDPGGVDVGYSQPQPSGAFIIEGDEKGLLAMSTAFSSSHQCYLNGLEVPNCALILNLLRSGAGDVGPFQQAVAGTYNGQTALTMWHTYADGYQGYVPVTSQYIGAGVIREAIWITTFVDEYDPNRTYTFEATDENGELRTFTGYGSVVSTDRSGFTLNQVSAEQTYVTWRRLSLEELKLRADIIANLLTPACAGFVNNLVKTTTGKDYDANKQLVEDLMTVATSTKQWHSGVFYRSDIHTLGAGGLKGGSLTAGDASIYIDDTYTPLKSTLPYNIRKDAGTIFNEMMHVVADVNDAGGSAALAKMGVTPIGAGGNPLSFPTAPKSDVGPYSTYFHTGVDNVCKTQP